MDPATDRAVRRSAATIAFTTLLIVIVTTVAVLNPGARDWVRTRMHWRTPGFIVGTASELPPSLFNDADYTVLIFATTNCAACQAAKPFHRDLANVADRAPAVQGRVLLTSPGDDPAAYAHQIGVGVGHVATFEARGTRLRRVPTILVVNRKGDVVEMKEGVLPDNEQHALLERIRSIEPRARKILLPYLP